MICLLCNGKTKEYFKYSKEHGLVRCQECGLIQTKPMPSEGFLRDWYQKYDVLGEREPYYQALASDDPWKTSEGLDIARQFARVKGEISDIRHQTSEKLRVLDVGSGPGLFLDLVKRAGWEGVGIELNQKAVKQSHERFGIDARAGTLHSVGLPKESFDLITLWDIFEHVPDPCGLLRRAHALLKSGGLLFIETPNASSSLDWLVVGFARFGLRGPARTFYGLHHLTLWNHKNIRQVLEDLNFEAQKLEQDFTPAKRIFRTNSLKDGLMRFTVGLVQKIGKLTGRQNKMIVVAKKL